MVGAAAGAGPRGTTSTNEESVRMRRRKRLGKRRQQIKGSPGRSLSWHGALNLIAGRGAAQACHSASIGHPRSWLSPNDTPQVYRSDVHLQPRSRPRLPRTQPSTSPPGASLCFAPAPHRPSSARWRPSASHRDFFATEGGSRPAFCKMGAPRTELRAGGSAISRSIAVARSPPTLPNEASRVRYLMGQPPGCPI